jgi:hypothetical protein
LLEVRSSFWQAAAQKGTWIGSDWPAGACFRL